MKLPKQNDYPIYRCPSTSDCSRHVTISAAIAEQVVSDSARAALADVNGRASAQTTIRESEAALASAENALGAAVQAAVNGWLASHVYGGRVLLVRRGGRGIGSASRAHVREAWVCWYERRPVRRVRSRFAAEQSECVRGGVGWEFANWV
jgi:hypothetical protein